MGERCGLANAVQSQRAASTEAAEPLAAMTCAPENVRGASHQGRRAGSFQSKQAITRGEG
jgi:hypothetical protein